MAQALKINREPTVYVEGKEVVLVGFREIDGEFLQIILDSNDPALATHRVLATGARAIKLAQVSLDTALVEDAFEELSADLGKQVGEAVTSIEQATTAMLDEDGILPRTLEGWKEEVSHLLGSTFDENSKKSVLGFAGVPSPQDQPSP